MPVRPGGAQVGGPEDLAHRVKTEVDLRLLLPVDPDEEDFGRYRRRHCISPEHPDSNPTMLVFGDGCNCSACGFRADAIDVYRMFNPGAGFLEACEALLGNEDLKLSGDPEGGRGPARELDAAQALEAHLALVERPDAVEALLKMGFLLESIQRERLGVERVLVRLTKEDEPGQLNDIVWREDRSGRQVAYQWQERFSVPIFGEGGALKQVIYRKWDARYSAGTKVTMAYGGTAQLIGKESLKGAQTLLIVEGWGDRIIANQMGFAAVTSTNGAGHWSSEWTELVGHIPRIYLMGDADNAGALMNRHLKAALPWAKVVTLPWEMGSKQDLRDLWLAGWRRPEFVKYLRALDVKAAMAIVNLKERKFG